MKRDLDLIRSLLLNVESDGEHAGSAGHTDAEAADNVQQRDHEGVPCGLQLWRRTFPNGRYRS
jgi:hypothetical protein